MITPEVDRIVKAVRDEFRAEFADGRLYSLGVYNRRFIAGTSTWSQHAWGNAWDIGVRPDQRPALGDRVLTFLRAQDRVGALKVGTILWRVRDHFDHLHVEGDPKRTGTPPKGGESESDTMELVADIQKALIEAGYDLGDFEPFGTGYPRGADGDWGAKTHAAFVAAAKGGSVDLSGITVKGTFSGKVA